METSQTDLALWQHERRRRTLWIAVLVLAMLGFLFWFLTRRSAPNSPARQIKSVVFGRQITEAAEQMAGGREGDQNNRGQGQGQGEGQSAGQGEAQNPGQGQTGSEAGDGSSGAEGQATQGQAGGGNQSQGERGPGRKQGLGGPTNERLPGNNPAGPAAPAERSVGWLDRFFGTGQAEDAPVRAGEGGTGGNLPGSGNTNRTATPRSVAAQFTESNPPAPVEVSAEEPPALRATNRAPAAPNALNDNFEQLLRQHSAGSGDVRISLMWSNRNDIDLHVVEPSGEELNYRHRASRSGGLLDIDMNASPPLRSPAVENVYWPQRAAPAGAYRIYVNHYARHDRPDQTEFTVRVLIRGRTTDFHGSVRFGENRKLVHQFTLSAPPR